MTFARPTSASNGALAELPDFRFGVREGFRRCIDSSTGLEGFLHMAAGIVGRLVRSSSPSLQPKRSSPASMVRLL